LVHRSFEWAHLGLSFGKPFSQTNAGIVSKVNRAFMVFKAEYANNYAWMDKIHK
jgi:hypothetical protein